MAESAEMGRLPPVEFSEWFPWKDRSKIPNDDLPGAYLLARFEDRNPPKGKADLVDRHLILMKNPLRI